jgi:hypothetical protein
MDKHTSHLGGIFIDESGKNIEMDLKYFGVLNGFISLHISISDGPPLGT